MINNRWYLSCLICSLETVYIKYAYVSCRNSYITLSDIMTWPISFISVRPIFYVEKDCTDLTGGFLFQTLCGHFLLPTELRRLRLDLISEKVLIQSQFLGKYIFQYLKKMTAKFFSFGDEKSIWKYRKRVKPIFKINR